MKQQVMMIGLGLIGASLALCIKQAHPAYHLIGWDSCENTLQEAKAQEIINEIPESFEAGVKKADVIVLAVPVKTAKSYLKKLQQIHLKNGVLVTDTGSTKQELVAFAKDLSFDFIGGHPMAGSHKSGIQAADINLFENAYFIFTPEGNERLKELQVLFSGTRSKYVELSAADHDQITGMLSHLPHIIASGLVKQAKTFSKEYPNAEQLAAGGFRDITRIASSDPAMWTDILLSNQETLISQIKDWQEQMQLIKEWLETKQQDKIFAFFEEAKIARDRLPIHQNGAIPAFYDLFVDVPDKPGVIAEIAGLLGENKLSLVNIKILETREEIMGILQITFKTQQDLLAAKQLITQKTVYNCQIK